MYNKMTLYVVRYGMVGLKIGLDIGSGAVTAAVEGKGVVLAEPAVLAVET